MHVLLESGARPRSAKGGWTLASAAAHAGLVTAAVVATAHTAPRAIEPVRQDTVIYIDPVQRAPREATSTSDWPRLPIDGPVIEVPRVPVPGPVDLTRTNIEPTVIGEIGSSTPLPGGPTAPATGVYSASMVERTVAPRADNPHPNYPAQLRATGLQGSVVVRFVVDTSGAVEQGSIVVLESTHDAFSDAIRVWLPRTRYFAAEVAGRHVRQLVQQRVEFQLR